MVDIDRMHMMRSRRELMQAMQELLIALEDRLDDLEWMCQRTADEVALLSAAAAEKEKGGSRSCNKKTTMQ